MKIKKPVKCGEDFVRDDQWRPVVRDRQGAEAIGRRLIPADLLRFGFGVSVFEADDYFRISFGRKA